MYESILILGGGIVGRMVQATIGRGLILEAKDELPPSKLNQAYGANYLWQTIPIFETRPMEIVTRIDGVLPTEESIRRYKNKIGKGNESVAEWGLQFKPNTKGYAITKFPISTIQFDRRILSIDLEHHKVITESKEGLHEYTYDVLVNTLPLYDFTELCNLSNLFPIKTTFKFRPVYVKIIPLPLDASKNDDVIYVNYLSDPLVEPYRFCDRFGERHYESLYPMGFPHKKIYPGKIWSDFMLPNILTHLGKNDVVCFGRYGSWRPNELLHETYEEIIAWKNCKEYGKIS